MQPQRRQEGTILRSTGGASWVIESDIPYHVNYILWLYRQFDSSSSLPDATWRMWFTEVIAHRAVSGDHIAELAPDPNMKDLANRNWTNFLRGFNQDKKRLALRLTNESTRASLQDIMEGSDQHFRFFFTNHPGDLCWHVGEVWILGDVFLDAHQFRELVTRLRKGN